MKDLIERIDTFVKENKRGYITENSGRALEKLLQVMSPKKLYEAFVGKMPADDYAELVQKLGRMMDSMGNSRGLEYKRKAKEKRPTELKRDFDIAQEIFMGDYEKAVRESVKAVPERQKRDWLKDIAKLRNMEDVVSML